MYCSTKITTNSHHLVYTFIALLAAKCCCGRQANKRQVAANAVALLSTVRKVVLEKMCEVLHLAGRIKLVRVLGAAHVA